MEAPYFIVPYLFMGEVIPVRVEADIRPGLPFFRLIGYTAGSVIGIQERIRSALRNSHFRFPKGHITVNLVAPVPLEGTSFDLAIALSLLVISHSIPTPSQNWWVVGELGLSGELRLPGNIQALVMEANHLQQRCVIPWSAEIDSSFGVAMPRTLIEAISSLTEDKKEIYTHRIPFPHPVTRKSYLIDKVVGQDQAKRAVAIALAGQHHLLLSGVPGSGKTMLAQAAAELLPSFTQHDQLRYQKVVGSVQGISFDQGNNRPFITLSGRATKRTLLGDLLNRRIGEASLACGGVLFIDEFAEQLREVRESLRSVMEKHEVRLYGPSGVVALPGPTMVWAAMNRCPCGLLGDPEKACRCTAGDIIKYQRVLSEPLAERFTIHCQMSRVNLEKWEEYQMAAGLSGKEITLAVERCWQTAKKPRLNKKLAQELSVASQRLGFSGRVRTSLAQVASTIALFDGKDEVDLASIHEALQYRPRSD